MCKLMKLSMKLAWETEIISKGTLFQNNLYDYHQNIKYPKL